MNISGSVYSMELNDANYTWTDDPFGPDYEITYVYFEMMPLADHKNFKHHTILSKELYFSEENDG